VWVEGMEVAVVLMVVFLEKYYWKVMQVEAVVSLDQM
jgi:hypothetical protein